MYRGVCGNTVWEERLGVHVNQGCLNKERSGHLVAVFTDSMWASLEWTWEDVYSRGSRERWCLAWITYFFFLFKLFSRYFPSRSFKPYQISSNPVCLFVFFVWQKSKGLYQTLRAQRGNCQWHSRVGHGTIFTICLTNITSCPFKSGKSLVLCPWNPVPSHHLRSRVYQDLGRGIGQKFFNFLFVR